MIVMSLRTPLLAAACAVTLATLAGCGNGDAADSATTPVSAEKLNVVTSFYPLEFITKKVGGDRVDVTNLTAPGVEPHDLELTPKQVGTLAKAKLVVFEKDLQPAVDEAVAQNAAEAGFDVAPAAKLEATGADFGEEGEEVKPGALDPHFWLDPVRVGDVADAIADKLASTDPANADGYKQRAAALHGELTTLDNDFRTGLANCKLKVFVTSHSAFAYLAQRYGLQQVGIAGTSPDQEPSPAHLKEIHDIVTQNKVTTIFYEELVSPKVAESVARDLKVKTAVLSPIEGLADANSTEDYLSLMHENLAELKKANGCA
jgi:zinc transport system substrate-binding protein